MSRTFFAALVVSTLVFVTAAQAAGDDEFIEYTGVATARRSPAFLYGEHHLLAYRAGQLRERVVLYTCPDGAPFARKHVDYVDRTAPDFSFDDASNGMQEAVRSNGATRTVFFRSSRNEPQKSAPLPLVQGLVVDTGFDEFIRSHWSALLNGESLPLPFLVPSRLQAMNFEVVHVRGDALEGKPLQVFRLKLTGVLGLILPGIEVSYDATAHVLVRYEGLSDLRDASGANLQANILFPVSNRTQSSAGSWAAAKQVSIAACR